MKSTKWYMFFNTSKLLREDHKEFLETFDCEEHFSKWYINNFRHIVFGRKIVHFIDAVNISHKKHRASRLATFSYMPETKRLNIWQEIKEAFPFFWCKRIGGIVHTPWGMANGILNLEMTVTLPGAIRNIPCNVNFTFDDDHEPPLGRDWPEPISMAPYYIAVVVLVALLILDGFFTHWGLVDYSQILK